MATVQKNPLVEGLERAIEVVERMIFAARQDATELFFVRPQEVGELLR